MNRAQYEMLEDYMRACVADFSHGEDHISRVLHIAVDIAQTVENVDTDALICACLLHDVGRKEQMEDPTRHHAAVGAEKARLFLTRGGWDAAFARHVSDIIRTHSSADLARAGGMEGKILYDADKLDVVGSIGLCRTIVYVAQLGERIYDAHDLADAAPPAGGSILRAAKNDMVSAQKSFFTRRARQLAEGRIRSMNLFLEELRREAAFGEATAGDALNRLIED